MSGLALHLHQARSIRLTSNLGQAIGFLGMSDNQLAAFLAFRAQTNPFVEVVIPPSAASGNDRPAKGDGGAIGSTGGLDVDRVADGGRGLIEHVQSQIALTFRNPVQRRIAEHFVLALEPSGWLGQRVEDIAKTAGCAVETAKAVLTRLQDLEPAGLFARTLAECLRLQAADSGKLDPVMAGVLDNLPLIAKGHLAEVAELCGTTREQVAQRLGVIRGFDPKPGARFDPGRPTSIQPDVIVRARASGWEVDLPRSMANAVAVRAPEATGHADLSAAERELLDEARWIRRAAQKREQALIAVMAEIVRRQARFIAEGPLALRPMRLADVALATGLHESTVSRITSGRFVATPRGTLGLRQFFSGAVRGEADASASAVREEIRRMIAGEREDAPLSDQKLTDLLGRKGMDVARRTVAKYREQLGLAGSSDRRSAYRLARARRRS